MKMIVWEFNGLKVPMVEDSAGELFCTTKQLAEALQTTESHVRRIKDRHSDEFDGLSKTNCLAKDFLARNKSEFGIKRLREDVLIWSEDDMIMAAILIKSPVGKEFRKDLRKFVKANAMRGMVPVELVNRLIAETQEARAETAEMRSEFVALKEYLEASASLSGKALSVHKQAKNHLRLVS